MTQLESPPRPDPTPPSRDRRPAVRSFTERSDVRVWTVAMTAIVLMALVAAIAAVAMAKDAKDTAPSREVGATAAAPTSSIGFNAEPSASFRARDPRAPAPLAGTTHEITLHIKEHRVAIAPGTTQTVWTFGDTVPGPVYRGKVGDTFDFTIVNDGKITHSMDFHAGMVSPSTAMVSIDPGTSHHYVFRANKSGIFMYHCGTPPVLMHIGAGMYGAVIIDPPRLPAVGKEFVMLQSDLYTGPKGAAPELPKLLAGQGDAIVFNGYANQYKFRPIRVEPNERVRVWVLDDGPSVPSSFHVIGTIFDTMFKEGAYVLQPDAGQGGAQALDLAPAQGGFVEFAAAEPGNYAFVTHKFNDASRGAVGIFQVGEVPAGGSH